MGDEATGKKLFDDIRARARAALDKTLDAVAPKIIDFLGRLRYGRAPDDAVQPSRFILTCGHEALAFTVPQSHMHMILMNLKEQEFTEDHMIMPSEITYVVGSEHYWLTVDDANKRYYVSPRMVPLYLIPPDLEFELPEA